MGSEMGLSIVEKIVEKMVDPIVNAVVRQFSYMFFYKRNIQTLGDELALLEANGDGVQLRTAAAERNLEIVAPAVTLWLTRVEEIKTKALEVHGGTSNVEKGCLNGWCPNLKHRHLLSRKAIKLTEAIRKLKGEGIKDEKFSHSPPPRGIMSSEARPISPKDDGFKGFESRIATTKEVMDCLKDDKIYLIGISGMGGVGKTTLVNQVLQKVEEQRLFDEVAMAVVSETPDLFKVQGEIGEMLGLKFNDGSSVERAVRLCQRLKKGKRVLVVLEDIWEGIDMGEVGIPAGNGCKVVFTTRIERACTAMAAQAHIKVDVLSSQEAWGLFREASGGCVDNADIHDIAEEVVEECGGLPIAIVTLGKALAKREKYEWEDTLLQLKKSSGMHEKVQSSIMASYNFLGSCRPQAQPLLLICTLFQEDENIPIEKLVKYSMGLELFDDVETLEETRNRVYTLLNYLKSSNLMLHGDQGGEMCVKLHDIVRDVCLLIASNPQHSYFVRHDQELKQWPKAHGRTAISLMSGAMNELPAGLDYPNLRLLQLHLKDEHINIAGDFFQGMKGLGVFSFYANRDEYGVVLRSNVLLPTSLQLLTNLQMLSLEFVSLGGDVSSIGRLTGLKILSFFNTKLDEFPREIWQLKNLRLLDLRCDHRDLKIGNIVLSGLDQLEELYMGDYFSWVRNSDKIKDENSTSIEELNSLSCLTTLQITVFKSTILLALKESFLDKLKKFDISIGFQRYPCGEYGILRNSMFQEAYGLSLLSHTKLRLLVKRTQSLTLEGCRDKRFMIDEMDSACYAFHNLESLEIMHMGYLKEISHKIGYGCFHRLQELRLSYLPALKHIWRCHVQPPSLGNLRILKLKHCWSLESLFSLGVAKCLVQLEKLKIDCCRELKGLVSNRGSENNKGLEEILFPKLRYVRLESLPYLKSFYLESANGDLERNHGRVIFPSLDRMTIKEVECFKQIVEEMQDGAANKLRFLSLSMCEKLRTFVDSLSLQNLEEVDICSCESMEAVFDFEGLKVLGHDHTTFMYDKLELLKLVNLDKLVHVWRMVPEGLQGFRNLRTLKVDTCNELRYLLPGSVAKMLVNLRTLYLRFCPNLLSIIEGEDEDYSTEAISKENIVFPRLYSLVLFRLCRFTSFCSSTYTFDFPLLREVAIEGCPDMKIFCSGAINAPVLKERQHDEFEHWTWKGNLNNGIYTKRREVEKRDEEEDEAETERREETYWLSEWKRTYSGFSNEFDFYDDELSVKERDNSNDEDNDDEHDKWDISNYEDSDDENDDDNVSMSKTNDDTASFDDDDDDNVSTSKTNDDAASFDDDDDDNVSTSKTNDDDASFDDDDDTC